MPQYPGPLSADFAAKLPTQTPMAILFSRPVVQFSTADGAVRSKAGPGHPRLSDGQGEAEAGPTRWGCRDERGINAVVRRLWLGMRPNLQRQAAAVADRLVGLCRSTGGWPSQCDPRISVLAGRDRDQRLPYSKIRLWLIADSPQKDDINPRRRVSRASLRVSDDHHHALVVKTLNDQR